MISNQIPGALSEYLRVSNSDFFYEVSEPDVEGEVSVMITTTFGVIKLNAHIGYFELKAQVLSYTNKTLIYFDADYTPHPENKVNHNPYVGQQLANAIKDPNKKRLPLRFIKS